MRQNNYMFCFPSPIFNALKTQLYNHISTFFGNPKPSNFCVDFTLVLRLHPQRDVELMSQVVPVSRTGSFTLHYLLLDQNF